MTDKLYLILESNGKVVRAPRTTLPMTYEKTRLEVEGAFPGWTVLSPLEKPTGRGPLQVVTVYVSRSRDGRTRCTGLEQWGVE